MTNLLTITETAEFLHTSEKEVLSLIHSGELEAYDLSNHRKTKRIYLCSEDQLQAFLDDRKILPALDIQLFV